MGHRGFQRKNIQATTTHGITDASHALGITNIRLSVIHKAQTPSPAGLPLTQGESF